MFRYSIFISMIFIFCAILISCGGAAQKESKGGAMRTLTEQEARVIIHKGTEAPFTGEYLHNKRQGTYVCRQCGAPLYRSSDKFDSGCGWPSFDDALPGAVRRSPDPDGHRVEITCENCGGHLGHVFEGEQFTAKNTRHCVNSISMIFVPEEKAYFAGGCFWGVEDAFSHVEGVLDVASGYMGGHTENPTYEQVSRGNTGHAETVCVTYNPEVVDFKTLARLFFEIHDPTQKDRQGPDVGTQYRSAVFYGSEEQKTVTEALVEELRGKGWDVVTQIAPAGTFTLAEDYHQDFTRRTGRGACHIRVPRFDQGPR